MVCACKKSPGVVSLMLAASPSKTKTAWPAASAIPASSVNSRGPAAAARCASRMRSKPKDCGVLHGAQPRAVGRRDHEAGGVDFLHRVGERQAGNGGAMRLRDSNRAGDQRGADEGPGGVVDQHDVGAGRETGQRLEAIADAVLARRAAEAGRGQPRAGGRESSRRWSRNARRRRHGYPREQRL